MEHITEIGQVVKQLFVFLGLMIDPTKRKEAYSLYLTKRQRKAVDYAERYILEAGDLVEWMSDYMKLDKAETKEFKNNRKYLDRLKKSFFKYN